MAMKKASAIFGCAARNSISSWSWGWSSLSPLFWWGSIWVAALSVRHVYTRKKDKWVGIQSRASAAMKDSRWGKFQCILENWPVEEQARKQRGVNLFRDRMALKKQRHCKVSHSELWPLNSCHWFNTEHFWGVTQAFSQRADHQKGLQSKINYLFIVNCVFIRWSTSMAVSALVGKGIQKSKWIM